MHVRILCLAVLLSSFSLCFGQDDFGSSVDRPSFSDGPYVIPMGHWQAEGGFTTTRAAGATATTWGELELRFPLAKRWEVRVLNVTYQSGPSGASGLIDPSVGIKELFQLAVPGKKPALAGILLSTIPAGGNDFRTDAYQPTAKIAADYPVNDSLSVGGNIFVSDLGPSGSQFVQYGWSAYASNAIGPTSGAFVEAYGLLPEFDRGPDALFAQAGVTHLLGKMTQVDFRVGEGLKESRDGWWIGAGIAHRF